MNLMEHVSNRRWLTEKVRAEVVGPDPSGEAVITPKVTRLPDCTWSEFQKPKRQLNGEEVLWQDSPLKRYGAGILYPSGSRLIEIGDETDFELNSPFEYEANRSTSMDGVDESILARDISSTDDSDDYDVSLANAMSPSAIGLSFLADLSTLDSAISIELVNVSRSSSNKTFETASATYQRALVTVKNDKGKSTEKTVWLRKPLNAENGLYPTVKVETSELRDLKLRVLRKPVPNINGLEVLIVVRRWKKQDSAYSKYRLLTVSLVNKKNRTGNSDDESSIFQAGIRVVSASQNGWIVPYPESDNSSSEISEDILSDNAVNNVLYRHQQTYAIGHGCAADWLNPENGSVKSVWSDVLPVYETPSTTAELEFTNEKNELEKLKVSMRKLAGLDSVDSGWKDVSKLLSEYENWINSLRINELAKLFGLQADTGEALVQRCESCLKRIRDGVSLLEAEDTTGQFARRAFELSNHAMLLAQLRGGAEVRVPDCSTGIPKWTIPAKFHDPTVPHEYKGYWRPFQIAFLLMSLRGICDPHHADRNIVDLIWFPTGGGKTEAYLGVTAFTIFYNRLIGRETTGCDVLMRYTLRLLTAQQFQRAATLFCAMEHLRKSNQHELKTKPFTLGLWVGRGTTPNSRKDALAKLKNLENPGEENPFVILQCPWCAAKMGPLDSPEAEKSDRKSRYEKNLKQLVLGYVRSGTGSSQTVVYQCPDKHCDFSAESSLSLGKPPLLPIKTIDEDLIDNPPNLLIGTVDKFAMLAWKPDLRSFFGISEDGRHKSSPPSLIIQDELHLISGPLGTMVGAYEVVIDRLCRKNGLGPIGPKIIASTATISRAKEQIKHLYARKESMLFPPSGLSSADSFFAREAEGPGRMYMGIMAPGHFSLQTTEARVFATLLQSVPHMPTDEIGKDPWWTLLCFFNSLRELGSASTLMVADVREYMRVLMDRHGWDYKSMRNSIDSELTSRIRSDEIPKELAKLEIPLCKIDSEGDKKRPVDVCLASNVIEVGVDLPRLSLMSIVGQPKSTSQYIQVSSRVGRGKDKPGLVVALYGQSKPRDRSHYEHFRGYHQKLYAQVEPTSVTPFSAPAIERALHSVIVALVRQLSAFDSGARLPRPYPLAKGNWLANSIEEILRERSDIVTGGESTEEVIQLLHRRLNEWQSWDPSEYGELAKTPEAAPLMYPAGANAPSEWNKLSWPTLSSMRDVDASAEAVITDCFNTVTSAEKAE